MKRLKRKIISIDILDEHKNKTNIVITNNLVHTLLNRKKDTLKG